MNWMANATFDIFNADGGGEMIRCSGCRFPACKTHATSTASNSYHTTEECNVLRDSDLGRTVVSLTEDSLVLATVFLYRMWRLRQRDPLLFEDLYFQMDGDVTDIVS